MNERGVVLHCRCEVLGSQVADAVLMAKGQVPQGHVRPQGPGQEAGSLVADVVPSKMYLLQCRILLQSFGQMAGSFRAKPVVCTERVRVVGDEATPRRISSTVLFCFSASARHWAPDLPMLFPENKTLRTANKGI
eukprot:EG_transcript_23691